MSLVIEDYQRLSDITGQMRDAAAQGEWDRLVALEQECKRKVEEIKPRDVVPSSTEERAQKIALLKKILADDADIRNRTEGWMEQLQRIMQSTRSEQRLQQAYLANYQSVPQCMLPANLISTLKALALTDRPLITATPDKNLANANNTKFELGQKLQGTVQAQVAPNVFNVRVADQLLQMQLPAFIRSGDIITLQVASLQPRLTFTLAASSNPVSTPESLSATSRLLSSLSQQPLERSYVRPIHSSPLWTGAQTLPDTTQLASKLHDALSHSGLFYESHQAQWIAGTRPTTQLLLEPQNQLPNNVPAANNKTLTLQNLPDGGNRPISTLSMPDGSGKDTFSPSLSTSAPSLPHLSDDLRTLVQQQLNTLETRQVLWQGQVWQGQEMTWEVREDSPHRNIRGEEEGQWNTQIHLDMPKLGGVTARLSFTDGALNLTLDASNPQTRERLGSASSQLIAALSERGIRVTHTQITQNEQP